MAFDDVFICYRGFHPSDFTKSYLSSIMREVHEESPYGALLKASFSRKKETFKGIVHVTSSAGTFFAAAKGRGVKEVSKKLLEQLRRQLDKWKTSRFKHESLRKYA